MRLLRLSLYARYGCLIGLLGLFFGCAQTPGGAMTDSRLQATVTANGDTLQTPAEQYAGEVLAYMIQVTLGKAGNPKLREEWRSRGLNLPLDFSAISNLMQGPEKDPRRVMVLDNNILGLSQVLYHYDKSLNLFKERGGQESVFPMHPTSCPPAVAAAKDGSRRKSEHASADGQKGTASGSSCHSIRDRAG